MKRKKWALKNKEYVEVRRARVLAAWVAVLRELREREVPDVLGCSYEKALAARKWAKRLGWVVTDWTSEGHAALRATRCTDVMFERVLGRRPLVDDVRVRATIGGGV